MKNYQELQKHTIDISAPSETYLAGSLQLAEINCKYTFVWLARMNKNPTFQALFLL